MFFFSLNEREGWKKQCPHVNLQGRGMGCKYLTHLRLKKSRFCILCIRMNHFEEHLMISSREIDFKVLRMAI